MINKISRTEIVSGARDYRLMNRKMVDAVLEMSEYNRFSKEFSDGSGSAPNGWNMRILKDLPEKQNGM